MFASKQGIYITCSKAQGTMEKEVQRIEEAKVRKESCETHHSCGDLHKAPPLTERLGAEGGNISFRGTAYEQTSYLPYFLRTGFSMNLELINLIRLSGQQVPGILLSLPFQCEDYSYSPLCLILQVLSQAQNSLRHPISPWVYIHSTSSSSVLIFNLPSSLF